MQANNQDISTAFSEEEKIQFSQLLTLRKSDNAHFRREFKALGEQQSRFMEYLALNERRGPILNGFRLSEQQNAPIAPAATTKDKKRRCTLL